MSKIIDYLKGSRAELKKVVWPTRKTTRDHTIVVIVISLAVAAFLGSIDFLIEALILKPFIGG